MRSHADVSRNARRLAAWLLTAAAALPPQGAWGQTLIDALMSTYNTNPDLLGQRAQLRQIDETVNPALADRRPPVRAQADYGIHRQNSSLRRPNVPDLGSRGHFRPTGNSQR
ncbi:hypothetical protein FHP25_01350 [Vineibacter terrae]|uniref:TolC family protein n=1 Tax=Vineibacter terrae TaxID=2586908 RepID=A0A5C8PWE0_9HYPH|nr:hypothetical protein [Vineibacter terrae]TXL82371.1 hypothetical protein FHP25_01350 [Vineibacter terrae]